MIDYQKHVVWGNAMFGIDIQRVLIILPRGAATTAIVLGLAVAGAGVLFGRTSND